MTNSRSSKRAALAQLGERRRNANWPGYRNIGDFASGAFESVHVSPYTKGACNVDAPVFVLLQDWVSEDFLSTGDNENLKTLGREPSLPTNKNLEALLQVHFGMDVHQVYATNLFPFVKPAGMSANIPAKDLRRAAQEFALPQIEIVSPRLVVTLGVKTFNALRSVLGMRSCRNLTEALESSFAYSDATVWCQAHTGALGRANRNRGGVDRVSEDWGRMADWHRSTG
ncbi:MAG: hypothetical protein AAGM16_12885 [Pseudomonadota bacterium]